MEDIIVLGLAAVGGISIIYSLFALGGAIIGAIGGAIGCGILGLFVGLLFLGEAAGGFTAICAIIGLGVGAVGGLLRATHGPDESDPNYVYNPQTAHLTKRGTLTFVIVTLALGLAGAAIAGATSEGDTVRTLAGYGGGSMVGMLVWRFLRDSIDGILRTLGFD